MTWIIHRGNRNQILNVSAYDKIARVGRKIGLVKRDVDLILLEYEGEEDAIQAFGYLMDAIKKGERLVHI